MKKLSIIIVTYNSEKYVYDCLDSIFRFNDIGDELEIVIVDNNSNSFNSMKIKIENNYKYDVKVVNNTRNSGYGQGNNIGVAHATSDIIMIMNPDVTVKQPFFNETIEVLSEENVVMCGYASYENLTTPNVSFQYLPSVTLFESRKLAKAVYNQNYMFLSGACFSIRKDVFNSIGGFDSNMFMYYEESDINYKIRNCSKDYIIRFLPHIGYVHPQLKDVTAGVTYYKRLYKSLSYLLDKHHISKSKVLLNEILNMHISFCMGVIKGLPNAIATYLKNVKRFCYMLIFFYAKK